MKNLDHLPIIVHNTSFDVYYKNETIIHVSLASDDLEQELLNVLSDDVLGAMKALIKNWG